MKLTLEFIPIDDERKPSTAEDIFVLTPTSWYVDTYNVDFNEVLEGVKGLM